MKRYIYILMCMLPLAAMQSCINEDVDFEPVEIAGDYISLEILSNGQQTRATIEDNAIEEALSHLDVLIFSEDGDDKIYSERIFADAAQGSVKLGLKRSDYLTKDAKYFVYAIANSTLPVSTFTALTSVDELHELDQVDERIHITGSSVKDSPSHFLMDGVAFLASDATEPASPAAIVLYDGNDAESTKIKVNLRRAAAKIVVRLAKGDNVTFVQNAHIGYYLRNMPYSTTLIPLANSTDKPDPLLRTPDKITGDYFLWSADMIEVTAYLYSHAWEANSFFEKGTSLVVNLPMEYEGEVFENSYYQIALRPSDMLSFERNRQYTITGVVNAPGAEEVSPPVVIDDLRYAVREWEEVHVDVNGEDAPQFLAVNIDTLRMYHEPVDANSLHFSSSSKISISVFDAHYINKFGIKTSISATGISGTTAGGVSGNITVTSPIPTNNTIRYFGLGITNEEGLKDTVYVEQYPLIYITNQQGWYSYRDDFKRTDANPTTYEYKGDNINYVTYTRTNRGTNSRPVYEYGYSYGSGTNGGFWRSKVATPLSNGMSNIEFYTWNNASGSTPNVSRAENGSNARMYHIRVTSTSTEYKVGRPRMTDDGYTDPGADNAELVSPSFMIASRLGYVQVGEGGINNANTDSLRVELYRNHCANYVEVYKDKNNNKVELRDWRLPTAAELKIIMDLQGTGNNADAIDYLLNATYYIAANGQVFNDKSEGSWTTIAGRCVRDAYEK